MAVGFLKQVHQNCCVCTSALLVFHWCLLREENGQKIPSYVNWIAQFFPTLSSTSIWLYLLLDASGTLLQVQSKSKILYQKCTLPSLIWLAGSTTAMPADSKLSALGPKMRCSIWKGPAAAVKKHQGQANPSWPHADTSSKTMKYDKIEWNYMKLWDASPAIQ